MSSATLLRLAGTTRAGSRRFRLPGADGPAFHVYRPAHLRHDLPPLVSVHGVSRNAQEHLALFAPHAERAGRLLVVPVFTTTRHRGYQRLARARGGRHADELLLAVLAAVQRDTGIATDRVRLFGFSGGAQFAHRFALAHPDRVDALLLACAGWYTYPDATLEFPLGTGSTPARRRFDVDAFLGLPMTVITAELDTERDANLNRTSDLDARTGANRNERAARWVAAVRAAALLRGVRSSVTALQLPGCGHSFRDCMTRGGMGRIVLGTPTRQVSEPARRPAATAGA